MAEIIYMPKLSDTMTDGVVAEWHKKIGDTVSNGELLAEIETDKATMEFESFFDGTLLHIGVEKGVSVPVNVILAIIGEAGEDISALITDSSVVLEEAKIESKPISSSNEVSLPVTSPTPSPIKVNPIATSNANGRTFASPLAKKMAEEKGIDINTVNGTGDGGRVVKRDVDHYVPYSHAVGSTPVYSDGNAQESFVDEPVSQMRKVIARRLAESKFSAPHFYLTIDVNMDNAIDARKIMNSKEGVKISFNDMVVKAVALSLKQHTTINSSWLGDVVRRNSHVHIGIAVAVEDGLLVPVVRFADTKGMAQIGQEVKVFAQKAKDKKLQPSDWEGNTFTISNLGMFGIDSFTAIINPPDSCILAVGGISQVPVVKNGQVVPGNIMKLTLSCDHRVVDGASGAAFLQTLKGYLENPVSMLA